MKAQKQEKKEAMAVSAQVLSTLTGEKKGCRFVIAWKGRCQCETASEVSPFCADHQKAPCSKCGKQATRECASIDRKGRICRMKYCASCLCEQHGSSN